MRIARVIRAFVVLGCTAAGLVLAGHTLKESDDLIPKAKAQASGSRLKPKFTRGSDGSKLYVPDTLYDSELDIDCRFAIAADGKTRCLPIAGGAVGSVIRYKDANCSQPLIAYDRGTPPAGCPFDALPTYVFVYDEFQQDCDPLRIHIYPLGAVSNAAATYLLNEAGVCQGNSSLGPNTWQIGTEVPASTFVEGTPTTDP